jgi:hypothetical protein
MRRHHPNWRSAWLVAGVLVVVGSGGCRSQQTPLANPFMSPDRVPPPTTRTLAPGTAQPYYPGDPLPVMQSAVTPPGATTVSAITPIQSAAGSPTTCAEQAISAACDGPVAIPDDGGGLRFALPTAAPAPTAPAVNQPSLQLAGVPTEQPVQPALYTTPAINPQMPTVSIPAGAIDTGQLGPWRSPQIASTPVSPTSSVLTAPGTFLVAGQPDMSVRLRPVPSAEIECSPTPRIRLPGYTSDVQQPIVVGGAVQTVQITELPGSTASGVAPAAYASPALSVASQPSYIDSASPDGFRPRGSTR